MDVANECLQQIGNVSASEKEDLRVVLEQLREVFTEIEGTLVGKGKFEWPFVDLQKLANKNLTGLLNPNHEGFDNSKDLIRKLVS
jgi:hypothetical protein